METRFQTTSFIPKASLDNVVSEDGHLQKQRSSGGVSLMTLFALLVFIGSVVSAVVVFFLVNIEVANKEQLRKDINAYQSRITAETISELKHIEDRLKLIEVLVKSHVKTSRIFRELESNTLKRVSFNSFDLKKKPDQSFSLSLKAQGIGYESIVAQDKKFSDIIAQKTFKNTSITDFSKPKGQDISSFNIITTIAPSAANFALHLDDGDSKDEKNIKSKNENKDNSKNNSTSSVNSGLNQNNTNIPIID